MLGFWLRTEKGRSVEGWLLELAASSIYFEVENHAATQRQVLFDTHDPGTGAWEFCCGTHDFDGNIVAYCKGIADPTTTAAPCGVIAPTTAATIGIDSDGSSDFAGDIGDVYYFGGTVLSAANVAAIYNTFLGINDTKGAPVTQSNTDPTCATVDGLLECYGDDMPVLGSGMPPGMTGAGNPHSGIMLSPSGANSVIQSDTLSVSWTTVDGGGAAVVSTAAT